MAISTLNIEPMVLVHGGAGYISDNAIPGMHCGVCNAARIGYKTLNKTGCVLEAVQEAVSCMETDPAFNAGYGSALTSDGTVEMDAAIMHGATLDAGCVSCAQDINHPIVLARRIMMQTPHKFLAGEGAMNFAVEHGFPLHPEGTLVTYNALNALQNFKKSLHSSGNFEELTASTLYREFGEPSAVGAVAIDAYGNVAAATSTGGITGKMPGCISNSAILGGGIYADNAAGAVSATGDCEVLMRYNAASRILAQIEEGNITAQEATEKVLNDMMQRFNKTTGAICIDRNGTLGIFFTSPHMSWAYQRDHKLHFGIVPGEDQVKILETFKFPRK